MHKVAHYAEFTREFLLSVFVQPLFCLKLAQNMARLFNNPTMNLAHKVMDFRTQRHDILSSNIANKDTPGYRAEDLVFERSLRTAMNATETPGNMRVTDMRHFTGNNAPPVNAVQAQRIHSAAPNPGFNGNTVNLDKETAKIAENQLMYNASMRMMSHQFRMLKTVISGGR